MNLIFDTDILSTFAKANAIQFLEKLYSNDNLYITATIIEELKVPKEFGYDFPDMVFNSKKFKTVNLNEHEIKKFKEGLLKQNNLHKGEVEALIICKNREYVFSSSDSGALKFAKTNGIKVIELHTILKALWYFNVISKQEVQNLIDVMEKKDNMVIKNKEIIFTED